MLPKIDDRVQEITVTTGAGDVTFGGAVAGYRTFASVRSDNDLFYYGIVSGVNFEEGIGTFHSATNSFSRTTIKTSSNSNLAITLSGTSYIYIPILSLMHPLTTKGDLLTADTLPNRLAVGSDGKLLVADSSQSLGIKWDVQTFTKSAVIYLSTGIANTAVAFYATKMPFACTVSKVRGKCVGGTSCTINARKNSTSTHLSSDLSVTQGAGWTDGGAVQNTAYAAGDDLELMIQSVTGAVTMIGIEVEFTRP